jgi:iron(III) transport system permease protein
VADGAAGAARLPRPRFLSGPALVLGALALYVTLTSLWPLARLFAEALGRGEDGAFLGILAEEWQSRSTWRAFRNTVEASVLATLLSVLVGGAAAVLVALTDVRAKSAAVFVLLLPLLVPSQITALAWVELSGPSSPILGALGLAPPPGTTNPLYSKWGVVLVMGVEHAPLVFLSLRAALASLPRDLVEAARLGGARPARIVRTVLLPLAAPALLGGAALAFIASIGNFGVPAFLGIPGRFTMLTTLIYQRLQAFGPTVLGEVAALALILTVLAVAGLAVRAVLSARGRSEVERSGPRLVPFALGRARLPVEVALWVVLLVIAVLPLFALLATSLLPALGVPLTAATATLENYSFVMLDYSAAQRAFLNSFALAVSAAVASAAAAVVLAYFAVLQRNPFARALDLLADAPYAIPGTVLGIAIILVYLPPLPLIGVSLYNTFAILLVAYLARFLALGVRPVVAATEAIERSLDEAARGAGAGVALRLRAVVLPLVAPAAAAGGLLIFMQAFNELTVSALLWSTGWETVGVVIFFLHREGNSTAAAALATLSLVVTLLLAFLASLLARRLPDGVVPWRA